MHQGGGGGLSDYLHVLALRYIGLDNQTIRYGIYFTPTQLELRELTLQEQ